MRFTLRTLAHLAPHCARIAHWFRAASRGSTSFCAPRLVCRFSGLHICGAVAGCYGFRTTLPGHRIRFVTGSHSGLHSCIAHAHLVCSRLPRTFAHNAAHSGFASCLLPLWFAACDITPPALALVSHLVFFFFFFFWFARFWFAPSWFAACTAHRRCCGSRTFTTPRFYAITPTVAVYTSRFYLLLTLPAGYLVILSVHTSRMVFSGLHARFTRFFLCTHVPPGCSSSFTRFVPSFGLHSSRLPRLQFAFTAHTVCRSRLRFTVHGSRFGLVAHTWFTLTFFSFWTARFAFTSRLVTARTWFTWFFSRGCGLPQVLRLRLRTRGLVAPWLHRLLTVYVPRFVCRTHHLCGLRLFCWLYGYARTHTFTHSSLPVLQVTRLHGSVTLRFGFYTHTVYRTTYVRFWLFAHGYLLRLPHYTQFTFYTRTRAPRFFTLRSFCTRIHLVWVAHTSVHLVYVTVLYVLRYGYVPVHITSQV